MPEFLRTREAIYLRINHKEIQLVSRRMIDATFISGFYRFERIIYLAKMRAFPLLIRKKRPIIPYTRRSIVIVR